MKRKRKVRKITWLVALGNIGTASLEFYYGEFVATIAFLALGIITVSNDVTVYWACRVTAAGERGDMIESAMEGIKRDMSLHEWLMGEFERSRLNA